MGMLLRGFTSVRDLGSPVFGLKRGIDTGVVAGPRIWPSGALAKKFKIKTAWGSDIRFNAEVAGRQGAALTKMVRWYTPAKALRMATSDNTELLALSALALLGCNRSSSTPS